MTRISITDYANAFDLTVNEAIDAADKAGLAIGMFASPIDSACFIEEGGDGISNEKAREVAAEDAGLLYLDAKKTLAAWARGAVASHMNACDLRTQADVDAVEAYDPGNGPDVAGQILGERSAWSLSGGEEIAESLDDGSDEWFDAADEAWDALECAARRAYKAMPTE